MKRINDISESMIHSDIHQLVHVLIIVVAQTCLYELAVSCGDLLWCILQMSSDVPGYFTNTIKGEQRRNFRFNLWWFRENPAGGKFLTEEGEDETS